MRYLVALLLLMSLLGCAQLTYRASDGATVTYTRFLTGSDTIKGSVDKATIESTGQKSIDPALIETLIDLLSITYKVAK